MADRGWISLVWPVPSSKTITQTFGENFDYYHTKFGWLIGHSALDLRTKTTSFRAGLHVHCDGAGG